MLLIMNIIARTSHFKWWGNNWIHTF